MKRSRLRLTVISVALVCLMLGVSFSAVSQPRPVSSNVGQPKPVSLKGRIFFSDPDQPISDALIVLRNETTWSSEHLFETTSDRQGNYSFPELTDGVYTITIKAPLKRQDSEPCQLFLQNAKTSSIAQARDRFTTSLSGFPIKAGKEIVKDFDFACKKSVTALDFERRVVGPALKMLEAKKVPFDPDLLLRDRWRTELESKFQQIPELQKQVRAPRRMKGVYLAETILLPERVELTGDTFILAREFAPIDENSTISITGEHRLVIFVIGVEKQYQAMIGRRSSQLLKVDIGGPCGFAGIAPIFNAQMRCRGLGWWETFKR